MVTDVISWVMKDEKILKLKNADETYDLEEKLFTSLDKSGVLDKLEDVEVEVKIDGGKVTDLQVVGGTKETKKEPEPETPKAEEKTEDVSKDRISKELTVNGVSVAKKGVIFKEEEKVWYTLDDSIDAQTFKDTYTGKTVEVYIEETDKGNDIITGFTAKEEGQNVAKEEPSKNSYGTPVGNSIEAQASLKCAKVIVANMVTPDSTKEFVLGLITTIAQHAYKTLQELKTKG